MSIFGDNYSRYYNLLYKDKDYKSETDYIEKIIKKYSQASGKILLDIGCGTGCHLKHFAEKGYDIFGVDLSSGMIEKAKEYLKKDEGLYCAKASDFKIDKKFDVIVSLFHVMSYQTENSELEKIFKNIFDHLNSGGIFIFDFWYDPACLTDKPSVRIKRLEDENVKITRLTEPVMHSNINIIDVNFEVIIEDKKTKIIDVINETHYMRYFFLPELEQYVKQAGLKVLDSFEWMKTEGLSFDSWYGVMVVGT